MKKVSVVITTYKKPERLKKAIQTVFGQTYKDLEIIVADGSNLKENEEIANSFSVDYVSVEPEFVDASFWKGVQHTRNIGCNKACGKYIAMLDDDDVWKPTKIEKQVQLMEKAKADMSVCYDRTESNNKIIENKPKMNPRYKDLLSSFNFSSTSSYVIKKDVFEKIGIWNEHIRGMHEYDLALRIAKNDYKIVVVPEFLTFRKSSTGRFSFFIKIAEVLDFWKGYGEDFILYLGVKGFILNSFKTIALFGTFLLGYIIKEKVWNIIYPLKMLYEQGGNKCITS